MVLEKAIYKKFEGIVGIENLSDDDVMTEIYAYNWCMELINYMEDRAPIPFSFRPKAVLLPKTTEEVSEIIKICNDFKIQVKAQSTGLGPWNNVSTDNAIILDLKRMNKIIKIDEKNLYAVVEPYVSGAQLQAELMKIDLNCHMPGAGPQTSPLASATSMCGPGFTSSSTSHSSRNVLAVEWVLPTGEILKIGSAGMLNEPDWYYGDGPGPSLRGVMRGFMGAKSGLGVFTKVGIKLFPYPCSTKWITKGVSPNYDFTIPDFIKFYVFDCGSYKKMIKIAEEIEEYEIPFMLSHLSSFAIMAIFSNSIESLMDKMNLGQMKVPLVVIITGRTEREFNYKTKVLDKLLEKYKFNNIIGDTFNPPNISYAEALRSNLGLHGFIATGGFQSSHGAMETLKMCTNSIKNNIPLKKKFINEGVIANDFGEGAWATSYEHGHMYHVEMPTMFDQTKEESVCGTANYFEKANQLDLVKHLGIPFFIEGDKAHDWYGPQCSQYHLWLRKIKASFDPNGIADSGFYISS
ncbi:MAG: FAD-binding oxidoreductase, partial [Candidatus Lokiarchaeota archaeon]